MIDEYMEKVEEMAKEAPEPKDAYYLSIGDGEYAEGFYCLECARKVIAWLRDGGEQPDFTHGEYPYFASIDKDEIYIVTDYSHEDDSCRHCELCGAHLCVALLPYGVESELEHFEENGIKDADDWRHFYDVCEGIKHVEREWFPLRGMKESEIKVHQDLYQRTINLLGKHFLPQVEAKDAQILKAYKPTKSKRRCAFCTSRSCYERVVTRDMLFDELACRRHKDDLYWLSDIHLPGVGKMFISSTGYLERGDKVNFEEFKQEAQQLLSEALR